MPTNQDILDALRDAYLKLVQQSNNGEPLVATVSFRDGDSVTFRSLDKVRTEIEYWEKRVQGDAGGGFCQVLGRLRD